MKERSKHAKFLCGLCVCVPPISLLKHLTDNYSIWNEGYATVGQSSAVLTNVIH